MAHVAVVQGNLERFSGFADLYDSVRPSPPAELGTLLATYAGTPQPAVVDLGSGSGLSSRWAATWAASVVGVEPNADMRAIAESRTVPGVSFRPGVSHQTGLPDGSADVVLAVQAMHWMDPGPTLAEVARVLRSGGVLAVVDCDWPPVAGNARAEQAWVDVDRRIAAVEERLAGGRRMPAGTGGTDRHGSVEPGVVGAAVGPTGPQDRLGGARKWAKAGHLPRMAASGHFAFTRELALSHPVEGGTERFVALMQSQGTYQQLSRRGCSDEELGMDRFVAEVAAAWAGAPVPPVLAFTWRVRLGVTPAV